MLKTSDKMEKDFTNFKQHFVQPIPKYGVRAKGKQWRMRNFCLHDTEIKKHLNNLQSVACLGRWYSEYAVFDFDNVSLDRVEEIRTEAGLNEDNSMLFASESQESTHLYFRPIYNGKPPTLRLMQKAIKQYAKNRGIEIYPQKNRVFRLPLGPYSKPMDFQHRFLEKWQDKLYWMEKLDDFDLKSMSYQQVQIPFKLNQDSGLILPTNMPAIDILTRGKELLETGLQSPSSRDESQFILARYFFRLNLPPDEASAQIWAWINKRHSGYSKDFLRHPRDVQAHIRHQVDTYYTRMGWSAILPDVPHKVYNGFICAEDLFDIIEIAKGNFYFMRFLFNFVKYMNPRKNRNNISISSEQLIDWSSKRLYLKHLQKLDEVGLIKRGTSYLTPAYAEKLKTAPRAKTMRLNWNYKTEKDILFNGRCVETLEKAIALTLKPGEFRDLLKRYVSRQVAYASVKRVFEA